jgi:hypothetical protein
MLRRLLVLVMYVVPTRVAGNNEGKLSIQFDVATNPCIVEVTLGSPS